VLEHIESGGLGGYVEPAEEHDGRRGSSGSGAGSGSGRTGDARLIVRRGGTPLVDVRLRQIPATWDGAAWVNVSNALQAACAAIALSMSPKHVVLGLMTFTGEFEQAPGRLNRAMIGGREVIIDYGHNPAALSSLAEVVAAIRGGRRVVGAMSIPGDRREVDKIACGEIAGRMFDEVVLSEPNVRGRPPRETADIVMRAAGIPANFAEGGEVNAALEAFNRSRPGDLVVLCVDKAAAVRAALLEAASIG
jgi:cyanophycin synthetase